MPLAVRTCLGVPPRRPRRRATPSGTETSVAPVSSRKTTRVSSISPVARLVSRPVLFEHHLAYPAAVHIRAHPAVGVLALGQPVAEHEARDR